MELTVISVFSGCGGSSLGYKQAGFRELLAIDFNKNAVETFKLNFDCTIWQRDISKVSSKEILEFCKIKKGELNILDGSPPCQGFSSSGKRQVNDKRNDLFKEFVRLIRGLNPKVFVMENVSGLIKGKMKGRFIEIMQTLNTLDYQVKCKLMNAMYYQVPQSRQRLIWIGVRKDLNIKPSYPIPNTKVNTFRDACYDIRKEVADLPFNSKTRTALVMRSVLPGNSDPKHHSHCKLTWSRPSRTLLHDFLGYFHFWHPDQNRPLNLKEWCRISTFPDKFKWSDGKKQACQRIGNSVPPLFMKAIAKHISENILNK